MTCSNKIFNALFRGESGYCNQSELFLCPAAADAELISVNATVDYMYLVFSNGGGPVLDEPLIILRDSNHELSAMHLFLQHGCINENIIGMTGKTVGYSEKFGC